MSLVVVLPTLIFKAKCELLPHVKENGLLVLNGDDEFLTTLRGSTSVPGGREGTQLEHISQKRDLVFPLAVRQDLNSRPHGLGVGVVGVVQNGDMVCLGNRERIWNG